MKGKTRLLIVSAAMLAAVVCVGAALTTPRQADTQTPAAPDGGQSGQTPGAAVSTGAKYTVADYQGRLAVYLSAQMDAPQYITDVEVSTLPRADRLALADGIPIYTEEELTSILEDYSS